MSRKQRPRNVGEQPVQDAETIMAATSIEELMPDPDRRTAALRALGAVVEHAHDLWPRTHPRAPKSRFPRYLVILQALARGRTITGAADELGISLNTARTHMHKARAELEAKTTPQAVAIAIRQGLIE